MAILTDALIWNLRVPEDGAKYRAMMKAIGQLLVEKFK